MDELQSTEAVARQLNRILASRTFHGAARSQALLRFLVDEMVQGRSDRLKEYTLGAEGLGKGETFDPRTDPIVRAEASRLRARLERYYAGEGTTDEIVIHLPKGTYVPQFRTRREASENEPIATATARPSTASLVWLTIAAITLAIVTAALWARPRPAIPPAHEPAVMRFDVDLGGLGTLSSEVGTDIILSPDGSRIVFAVQDASGQSHLNTRRLDQPAPVQLIGTEGARGPFMSPDGQWVAFWSGAKLKKIAVAGGPPQIICDAPDLLGGSWGDDGNIVAAFTRTQLWRVSSSSGSPTVLADFTADSITPRWPQVLPASKFVLFTAVGATGPNTYRHHRPSLARRRRDARHHSQRHIRSVSRSWISHVREPGDCVCRSILDRTHGSARNVDADSRRRWVLTGVWFRGDGCIPNGNACLSAKHGRRTVPSGMDR